MINIPLVILLIRNLWELISLFISLFIIENISNTRSMGIVFRFRLLIKDLLIALFAKIAM